MTGQALPIRNEAALRRPADRVAGVLWTLLLIAVTCTFPMRASAQVLVVLSDESAGYQSVADELRGGLKNVRDGRLRVDATVSGRVAAIDAPTFAAYELVVTVGLSAAHATVSREEGLAAPPRTLCLLIPRQSFEHLASAKGRVAAGTLSAVFIDQPLGRQLDLLHLALRPIDECTVLIPDRFPITSRLHCRD